ncbi:DUF2971 domain-containing protein [Stappia taiwanensis]|uniref:DUF2971 domain-containing protein n=1 Tax=Stappia taiwanensis TaxID=992267 RepID=A0A838XQ16_9HYPH|nr:DUF2971 domain-containing protein [Stappia taiwanensis]MBA4611141.1 DUF2971 domain-containing protein [Stappia taiwanensis]GGE86256.1 hypothetical protein GCM10007285_12340 [Stappia taiwanensis]
MNKTLKNLINEDEIRNFEIFHPYAFEKTINAIERPHPFVHYCTSAAAASMFDTENVWMRNATWMNDTSEIRYGIKCLDSALSSEAAKELNNILEINFPGIVNDINELTSAWTPHFAQETYITCLTEQLPNEELMGRLSMWRAYGGDANPVAISVSNGPFLRPSSALNAYTSPVAYLSKKEFCEEYERVARNIINNIDYLKERGRNHVLSYLFSAYRYAIICTKHPSFYEEREWRIIYQPTFELSRRLIEDQVVISHAPQRIFKIPLKDVPEEGFYGATLPDLFRKLLIGPSKSSDHLKREFIRTLEKKGVKNASAKVEISDVPLRV